MAKEKLTVAQIRKLLQNLNPLKIGEKANPVTLQRVKFILTGKMTKDIEGKEKAQFVQVTKLSEEAKKANPGLTSTRYLRIMKTDDFKEVTSADEILRTGRKPVPDNLFERQQPILYEQLVRMLREKNGEEYKYFEKMEPDAQGNPRVKLRNPVMGAFVTLNVPGHTKLDAEGKVLKGSKKDIATGKFGNAEEIVFRTDSFFLHEHDVDKLEDIAISRYQKLIEPMLVEEVKVSLDEGGNIIKKEVRSAVVENEDALGNDAPEKDEAGNDLP